MSIKLETDAIRTIAAFESITKVHARDCIMTDRCVYFLVDVKKIGRAIGKNGSVVRQMWRILGKPTRIFGYSKDPKEMIKSITPIKSVKIEDGSMIVTIQPKDRVLIIGRNGETIRVVRDFLKRHYNINNLKLRM